MPHIIYVIGPKREAIYLDGQKIDEAQHGDLDWRVVSKHVDTEEQAFDVFPTTRPGVPAPAPLPRPMTLFKAVWQEWGIDSIGQYHEYRYAIIDQYADGPHPDEWVYNDLPRPMTKDEATEYARLHALADLDWSRRYGRLPAWLQK